MRLVTIDLDKVRDGGCVWTATRWNEDGTEYPILAIDAAFNMADVKPCGYCRDCKWWNQAPYLKPPNGLCLKAYSPEALMWARCEEQCPVTRPNFGCVQFEPKEQA